MRRLLLVIEWVVVRVTRCFLNCLLSLGTSQCLIPSSFEISHPKLSSYFNVASHTGLFVLKQQLTPSSHSNSRRLGINLKLLLDCHQGLSTAFPRRRCFRWQLNFDYFLQWMKRAFGDKDIPHRTYGMSTKMTFATSIEFSFPILLGKQG